MFLFPPSMWVGNIFWEHTHRLMGSLVGLMAIIMAIWLWQTEGGGQGAGNSSDQSPRTPVGGRHWLRWFGIATLVAVALQGVMGGLRVIDLSTTWAVFHGITAQLVFCMTVLIAAATSKWWTQLRAPSRQGGAQGDRTAMARPCRDGAPIDDVLFPVRRAVYIALAAIFIQLTLGATMRHNGAGLAIPDFPLAYGSVVPPLSEKAIHNAMITWSDKPDTFAFSEHGWYSPFQVAIHWTHRLFAVVVFIAVGFMHGKIAGHARKVRKLFAPATACVIMLLAQVALGASIIWTGRHPEVATAHQTLGAILFATTALIAFRLNAIEHATGGAGCHGSARSAEQTRDEQPSTIRTGKALDGFGTQPAMHSIQGAGS